MALISCPECGKEISDKVKACPHCGYPFESSEDTQKELQKVEISSVNIKPENQKQLKKILFGVAGVLLLLAIGVVVLTQINKQKEVKAYNSYIDNLNLAMTTMLEGGSLAETQCNITGKVWYNSIYEKRDSETDEYTTRSGGNFYDDFNIALGNLYADSEILGRLSTIEANQIQVETQMKTLQNPPEGLEKSYETITELHSTYLALTEMAVNPIGSLQTFSESKNVKVEKFMEVFNRLKAQIPEKK